MTPREIDVLALICAGAADKLIASQLFISPKTVQSHLDRINEKIGIRRRSLLIAYARDHGIS